jgi:hypothetical protein
MAGSLSASFNAFLDAGGEWLRGINPAIPQSYDPKTSSFDACWYSPPREVFEDMLIAAVMFPAMLWYASRLWWTVALPAAPDAVYHPAAGGSSGAVDPADVWAGKRRYGVDGGVTPRAAHVSSWARFLHWADVAQQVGEGGGEGGSFACVAPRHAFSRRGRWRWWCATA